jgi:hypothetical protein
MPSLTLQLLLHSSCALYPARELLSHAINLSRQALLLKVRKKERSELLLTSSSARGKSLADKAIESDTLANKRISARNDLLNPGMATGKTLNRLSTF